MTAPTPRLSALTPEMLRHMRRGIEKEGLRVTPQGALVDTPHWPELGSALTHPHITTDFSESQLELVTGVHDTPAGCLRELGDIHGAVVQVLARHGGEMMWAGSMPCELPPDARIPIGQYGSSNVGLSKTVYRHGLSHRYGPRMQTISGIHYNWSIPALDNDGAFALIRNFRRHSFLLLWLFGASPAVPASFVEGLDHGLDRLSDDTFGLPWATSLRMGRLGYQSEAQASLAVSYNGLEGYAASLHQALTQPYAAYQAIGIGNAAEGWKQLSTTLLQIENEFYSTIRPKRVIHPGERPLHALRERGVEYVEVRCMDINPFLPLGIDEPTMRFLDLFLLHCLLTPSPQDTPEEIAALGRNQQRVATRGREPGLTLERHGQNVVLTDWARELVDECRPLAERLGELSGDGCWMRAWTRAHEGLSDPQALPSARVLQAMAQHGHSHTRFTLDCTRRNLVELGSHQPEGAERARWDTMATQSRESQARIEAADSMPFEVYRQAYLDEARLCPRSWRRA